MYEQNALVLSVWFSKHHLLKKAHKEAWVCQTGHIIGCGLGQNAGRTAGKGLPALPQHVSQA